MEQEDLYFTDADHANLIYFQFPKLLMYGEKYKEMGSDSKILYMIAMDLIKLSMKNGWKDKGTNRHYIKLSIEKIQELMSCGPQKARKLKSELESFGLIREKRMGLGLSNRIYVLQVKYTDKDIYKANNDHEGIENDELASSESPKKSSEEFGALDIPKKDENHHSGKMKIIDPESRKSSTIKNESIKNNSINVLDDDKRTSSPVHSEEELNTLISNFYEEVKDDLTERSFKSVIRKVMDKYRQGKVGSFRDYLATALIRKIEELELRRIKDNAKNEMRTQSSGEIADRLNKLQVSENIPFYNWLEDEE